MIEYKKYLWLKTILKNYTTITKKSLFDKKCFLNNFLYIEQNIKKNKNDCHSIKNETFLDHNDFHIVINILKEEKFKNVEKIIINFFEKRKSNERKL